MVLVYDCEIIRGIPNGKREEGIEYCEGWRDFVNMGISVIGACEYTYGNKPSEKYRVFLKDNFKEFHRLTREANLVVGFNNRKFDDILCLENGMTIDPWKSYDVLREAWLADGLNPDVFDFKTHVGFSLELFAQHNLGEGKTGNGALAPVLWQRGQYGTVIDYCLQDVRLTVKLLEKVLDGKALCVPKSRNVLLQLRRPSP